LLRDEELAAFFGNDTAALRRYEVLRALLAHGASQQQVALQFGISERTVRNILSTYARTERIASLHSQPTARTRRGTTQRELFVQALSSALSQEPAAGGDRLWRQAQAILGEIGAHLSRRTAYRILAELRSGNQRASASVVAIVRSALPMLLEDPPFALSASALAQHLLRSEHDPLRRGALLQQALRDAIDRLRPAGMVTSLERSWWPYLICSGEYQAGQSRAELQHQLALSVSTYTRAKRQGLERLSAILPQIVAQLLATPGAKAAQRLPRTPGFVGRRDEQSYYAWRLQTEGFAALWGMPGLGKTALAAELAAEGQRYGQTVLWHTCMPGNDSTLAGIVHSLAQTMAGYGYAKLWEQLRNGEQTPTDKELLEALASQLERHPSLIVIDDLHRLDSSNCMPLLALLHEMVRAGSVRLLTIGRRQPRVGDWPPLPGLEDREAQLLWSSTPLPPAQQWHDLYQATGGLPELLRLVAAHKRCDSSRGGGEWPELVAEWTREAIWNQLLPAEARLAAAMIEGERVGVTVQLGHVAAALGLPETTGAQLMELGLITIRDGVPIAAAVLRQEARAVLEAAHLLETVATLAELVRIGEMPGQPTASGFSSRSPQNSHEHASNPGGLELILRLRDVLERSSAYLDRRSSDASAHQLARELQQLRAALPDIARLR
jgi:transposase